MAWLVAVVAIAVVAGVIVALVARRRTAPDDIDSFRRQIDALSPEARRPTIERMNPSGETATDDDDGDADAEPT